MRTFWECFIPLFVALNTLGVLPIYLGLTEGLSRALDSLDPRSRHIIEARWLNEDNPATLHELAAVYGISAERVRQIEAKALQKMKAALAG
jgi:DNA-directed RNA polymerase sigma subunit (sigma70/sigma32)